MMPPIKLDWIARYKSILGDELRHAREMRGWSRPQLASRPSLGISPQTLATYELGTRSIPHVRLVQIALALEINLIELLERMHERLFPDPRSASGWDVDLVAASRLPDTELIPLSRWARCRQRDTEVKFVRIEPYALDPLAVLCGIDAVELQCRLPRPAATPAAIRVSAVRIAGRRMVILS